MMLNKRRIGVVALLLAGLAMASGTPAWGKHGKGLTNQKSGANTGANPSGHKDIAHGDIDFDSLSPRDCANYLCVSNGDLASEYIESGCPGQFSRYESDTEFELMESTSAGSTAEGSYSGVTSGTLLALAGASGVFAAGVGFLAGYKASPSFAYMRIPSLA